MAVYLEETKYRNIRLGQPADFTLDAFPDLMFSGKIFYIGTNTASEFSLIPAQQCFGKLHQSGTSHPAENIRREGDEEKREGGNAPVSLRNVRNR